MRHARHNDSAAVYDWSGPRLTHTFSDGQTYRLDSVYLYAPAFDAADYSFHGIAVYWVRQTKAGKDWKRGNAYLPESVEWVRARLGDAVADSILALVPDATAPVVESAPSVTHADYSVSVRAAYSRVTATRKSDGSSLGAFNTDHKIPSDQLHIVAEGAPVSGSGWVSNGAPNLSDLDAWYAAVELAATPIVAPVEEDDTFPVEYPPVIVPPRARSEVKRGFWNCCQNRPEFALAFDGENGTIVWYEACISCASNSPQFRGDRTIPLNRIPADYYRAPEPAHVPELTDGQLAAKLLSDPAVVELLNRYVIEPTYSNSSEFLSIVVDPNYGPQFPLANWAPDTEHVTIATLIGHIANYADEA